ncbi:putative thiol peroxidase, partial [Haemophilus influenzae]
KY